MPTARRAVAMRYRIWHVAVQKLCQTEMLCWSIQCRTPYGTPGIVRAEAQKLALDDFLRVQ